MLGIHHCRALFVGVFSIVAPLSVDALPAIPRDIYILDDNVVTRVDPDTGAQSTILSPGGFYVAASDLAVETDGHLLLKTANQAHLGGLDALYRVDPETVAESLLTTFATGGGVIAVASIPEPTTGLLLALGLVIVAAARANQSGDRSSRCENRESFALPNERLSFS